MSDIAEKLLKQIAMDEQSARAMTHAIGHIESRWSPTRLLRRCAADREIVQDWLDTTKDPHDGWTDDQLHARWAHSCYEYTTTEGQRKAWDYSTEPPRNEDGTVSDGWEFNSTESNPEAWERFDYHEERYWRRRVKPGPHIWVRYVPKHIKLLARGYGLEVEQ